MPILTSWLSIGKWGRVPHCLSSLPVSISRLCIILCEHWSKQVRAGLWLMVLWVMTHYFSMSWGVNKSELGCDICTSRSAAHPSLFWMPLGKFCHLRFITQGGEVGLAVVALEKSKRSMMCPCSLGSLSCMELHEGCGVCPAKPKKVVPVKLSLEEPWAPTASHRAELLRAVQTTGFAKWQGLMLRGASASWAPFFCSVLHIGLQPQVYVSLI